MLFRSCLLVAVSTAFATPVPPPPSGLTVTFNDLTDSLTATAVGDTGRLSGGCSFSYSLGEETCDTEIVAPSGFQFSSSTGFPGLEPFQGGILRIGETALTSGLLSDEIFAGAPALSLVLLDFGSDLNDNIGSCNATSPCQLVENGQVQVAGTITWVDANGVPVTDTVQFQSDVEPTSTVPEPTSLVLLATGLAATYRRWSR